MILLPKLGQAIDTIRMPAPSPGALEQLAERLADVSLPCHFEPKLSFLSRFLTAAAGDIEAAVNLIGDHLEWRKAFNVDELGKSPVESFLPKGVSLARLASFFPVLERGIDRNGRPVLYMLASRIDTRAAIKATSVDIVMRYQIWQRERSFARLDLYTQMPSKRQTPPYYIMVLDLAGTSLSQANSEFYSFIRRIMEMDQAHYPGRVSKLLLINAPMFFAIIWGAVKSWLNPITEKKILIVGTRRDDITRALSEYIDPVELPVDFGGQAPALPGPKCSEMELLCPILHRPLSIPTFFETASLKPATVQNSALDGSMGSLVSPTTVSSSLPLHYSRVESDSPMVPEAIQRPPSKYLERLCAMDSSIPNIKEALRAAIIAVEADTDAFERDAITIRLRLRQSARRHRLLPEGAAALRAAIEAAKLERDSHARSMAFAKNVMDVDRDQSAEEERRARARLEKMLDENRGLRRTLEVTLGASALRRVLEKAESDMNVA